MLRHLLFETKVGDWLLSVLERFGLAVVPAEDLSCVVYYHDPL